MAKRADTRSRDRRQEPATDVRQERDSEPDVARPRRPSVAVVIVLILIAAFGVARSVHPLSEYRDVQRERASLEAEVVLLEQENTAVKSEIDRLDHDTYLEALARSELNLARPGEDVFIVTGLPPTTSDAVVEEAPPEPGPLEKMVSSLRRLF